MMKSDPEPWRKKLRDGVREKTGRIARPRAKSRSLSASKD
jgi:hypothetical protein